MSCGDFPNWGLGNHPKDAKPCPTCDGTGFVRPATGPAPSVCDHVWVQHFDSSGAWWACVKCFCRMSMWLRGAPSTPMLMGPGTVVPSSAGIYP